MSRIRTQLGPRAKDGPTWKESGLLEGRCKKHSGYWLFLLFSSSSLVALPPFLSSSFPTSFLPLLVCYVSLPFSLPCFLTIFIFSSYPYHLHRLTNKRFPSSTPEGHTNPLWVAWIFNLEKSAKSNMWWLLNKRAASGSFFISLSIPSFLPIFFPSLFPSLLSWSLSSLIFFYVFVHYFSLFVSFLVFVPSPFPLFPSLALISFLSPHLPHFLPSFLR